MKAILKAEMWENTPLEAQSRNGIITDMHSLKTTAKVSRNSRKEKTLQNFGGDYDFFRPCEERTFCLLCRPGQSKSHHGLSGDETERQIKTELENETIDLSVIPSVCHLS